MGGHLQHNQELLLANLVDGKLPRNAGWSEVVELVRKLGEVREHDNNELEFVVGAERALFKRPHTHSLEVDEVSRLREFLRKAGVRDTVKGPAPSGRLVVVIDHHMARIYQDFGVGLPDQREAAIAPHDPRGFRRHLIHRKERHYAGQRAPEESSFYEEIAQDLKPATEIVLIGHGTGKSSALEFLVEYLKKHHPTIFSQVVATEVVDLSARTEPEIEAMAQERL